MKTIRIDISDTAYMDTYILSGDKPRKAVVICPGGGYGFTSPREAEPIAMQFTARGIHAFVLYYTTPPTHHTQPINELAAAVCNVRVNADDWCVDPDKIIVCGFSAGGHLAASLGVLWDKHERWTNAPCPDIENGLHKPNALILAYPVISTKQNVAHLGSFERLLGKGYTEELAGQYCLEEHVSASTPQSFIWHTQEDSSVFLDNTLLLVNSMYKNKVPVEYHVFPYGKHGLSLGTAETADDKRNETSHHSSVWIDLCMRWVEAYV